MRHGRYTALGEGDEGEGNGGDVRKIIGRWTWIKGKDDVRKMIGGRGKRNWG